MDCTRLLYTAKIRRLTPVYGVFTLRSERSCLVVSIPQHLGDVSGGFEYFHLGFPEKGVPAELDRVSRRTQRALSNCTIGCPASPTIHPKTFRGWFLTMGLEDLESYCIRDSPGETFQVS